MSDSNGTSKGITLHSNGGDFAVETSPGTFVPAIDPVTMKPTGEAQRFMLAHQPKPLDVSQLSSHQRSALLEAMHAQLNLLTTQVNALTAESNADRKRAAASEQSHIEFYNALKSEVTNVWANLRPLMAATFLQRLRWLLTGR